MSKRSLICLLAGLNILLLALLLFEAAPLPEARAQATPGGGNFVSVTAAITGQEYEVLYIADLETRRLHAFGPTNAQARNLTYFGSRDLEADFRRGSGNNTQAPSRPAP